MYKKKYIISISMLAISVLLLITSVYAWFALSMTGNVNELIVGTSGYQADVAFYLRKDDDSDYSNINKQEQLKEIINKAVPGDEFGFKTVIENKDSKPLVLNLYVLGIKSLHVGDDDDDLKDMLDVLYIDEGKINIEVISAEVKSETEYLSVNSPDSIQKYGFELNNYRLANVINPAGRLTAATDVIIPIGGSVTVTFKLCYDGRAWGKGKGENVNCQFTFDYFLAEIN